MRRGESMMTGSAPRARRGEAMTDHVREPVDDAAPGGAASGRMPVLYLSHGAPPLADDSVWTGQLSRWGKNLPKPTSILVVSAHWEAAPVTVGATEQVP